jgi:hypothetical protein
MDDLAWDADALAEKVLAATDGAGPGFRSAQGDRARRDPHHANDGLSVEAR